MNKFDTDECIKHGVDPKCLLQSESHISVTPSTLAVRVLRELGACDGLSLEAMAARVLDEWACAHFVSAASLLACMNQSAESTALKPTQMLYFMQKGDGGPIKIGVSSKPDRRIRQVGNGSDERLTMLACVTQDEVINERALHKRFSSHRKSGEWFEPCDELKQLIESLRTSGNGYGKGCED